MADDRQKVPARAKGGLARKRALSAKQRSAIAQKAAETRWGREPIAQATHGSPDKPLMIGDLQIPCYVLEDGRRVIVQTGLILALGMKKGGSSHKGGTRLAKFAAGKGMLPFVSKDLVEKTQAPILFRTPAGSIAFGFEATILADLCDALLEARKAGVLQAQQEHIAARAEMLVRGFARLGIIALIDEVTGYQRDRAKDALARILEAWIAKELQAWVQTFPTEFYEQMFRLRGLEYPTTSVRRPQYFGILTNDVVYKRLEPGVLTELKRVTPRNDGGRPTAKYFQSLTTNVGYPKLKEHLGAVVAFMKISKTWDEFMNRLDEHYPRCGETPMLPMDYDQGQDDGKGI